MTEKSGSNYPWYVEKNLRNKTFKGRENLKKIRKGKQRRREKIKKMKEVNKKYLEKTVKEKLKLKKKLKYRSIENALRERRKYSAHVAMTLLALILLLVNKILQIK